MHKPELCRSVVHAYHDDLAACCSWTAGAVDGAWPTVRFCLL